MSKERKQTFQITLTSDNPVTISQMMSISMLTNLRTQYGINVSDIELKKIEEGDK